LTAFYNAARAVRPNETPDSFIALKPEIPHASWLIEQLEERGSGNNVEIKTCVTYGDRGIKYREYSALGL
jgi:hypothetical protein